MSQKKRKKSLQRPRRFCKWSSEDCLPLIIYLYNNTLRISIHVLISSLHISHPYFEYIHILTESWPSSLLPSHEFPVRKICTLFHNRPSRIAQTFYYSFVLPVSSRKTSSVDIAFRDPFLPEAPMRLHRLDSNGFFHCQSAEQIGSCCG